MKHALLLLFVLCVSTAQAQFDYAFQKDYKTIKVINTHKQKELIVRGTDPCLSPDGRQLVYTVTDNEGTRSLAVMDLETQTSKPFRTKLTYGGRWSPKADYILFNEYDGHDWFVCIQKTDYTGYRRLGAGYGPTWQDNDTVVWHDMNRIFIQSIHTNQPQTIDIDQGMQDSVLVSSLTRFYRLPSRGLFVLNASNAHAEAPIAGPNDAIYLWNPTKNSVHTLTAYNVNAQCLSINGDTLIYSLYEKSRPFIYKQSINGSPAIRIREGNDASFRSF